MQRLQHQKLNRARPILRRLASPRLASRTHGSVTFPSYVFVSSSPIAGVAPFSVYTIVVAAPSVVRIATRSVRVARVPLGGSNATLARAPAASASATTHATPARAVVDARRRARRASIARGRASRCAALSRASRASRRDADAVARVRRGHRGGCYYKSEQLTFVRDVFASEDLLKLIDV